MSEINELLKTPRHRYLIIGGSVYIFEILVIIIAQALGAGPVISTGFSYVLGTLVSFFLQKILTFGDKRMHHRILAPQLIATAMLVVFNLCFSLLVAHLLAHHTPAIISRTIALAITTVWNFYIYKTRIFKNNEELINA